jgi:hypothetical protein
MRSVKEEREPRAFTVRVDLQPAAVAGRCPPLDSSRRIVSRERRLAVLLVPLIAGIDLYTICAGGAGADHLWYEPRQVSHVGDRRVNRIRRRRDVFGVLMLNVRS